MVGATRVLAADEISAEVTAGRGAPDGTSFAILALAAALAAGTVGQGAYYAAGQRVVAALLVVAVGASKLTHCWRWAELRCGVVIAIGALTSWLVMRSLLSGDVGAAVSVAALLTGTCVVILLCRGMTSITRDALGDVVVALATLAAMSAWAGVAWRWAPWVIESRGLWRGSGTLTYPNATAGLLVPVVLFECCRGVGRQPRPLAAMACCLLLAGSGATVSRGGLLALAAGALAASVLIGWRRFLAVVAPPAAGALIVVAGLVPSMGGGSSPRPGVAVITLVGGVAMTSWVSRPSRNVWAHAVVGVVGVATASGLVVRALGTGHVSLTSTDRVDAMGAALRQVARHPLIGIGPDATFTWRTDRRQAFVGGRYVHNEYLQVLTEFGAIGLLLLIALIAAIVWTIARPKVSRPWPGARAGVAAGVVALGVHSAFDFLWHVPIIPLTAAVLVGLTTPTPKEEP